MAQRVGRGIALLFHDHGTRRGWVVSSTPRPYFTPGKDTVPIVQEAGWAPGSVWKGGKSRPIGFRSPDRPTRNQSLYRLSYPAHIEMSTRNISWGAKAVGGLTTLPLSCAGCLEIWEPLPPGTPRVCPDLYRDRFTFTSLVQRKEFSWSKNFKGHFTYMHHCASPYQTLITSQMFQFKVERKNST